MIKKRNLDESLISWILGNAGLGPGIGKIRYIAKDSSATSQFRSYLQYCGVSDGDIFDDLQVAHDNCTAYQNDTCILFPGTWDVNLTAHGEDGILWSKANVNLIAAYPPTMYNGQTRIASQGTTGVNTTLSITTKESTFYGFGVTNSHSATNDIVAVQIGDAATSTSRNLYFKNVQMAGCIGASALSDADSTSLRLCSTGNNMFEDCQIGHTIAQKTAANSAMTFADGDTAWCNQNNIFRKCMFHTWSNTSTSYIVKSDGANCMDRLTYFDDCGFFNFDNAGAKPDAVLHFPAGTPTGFHVTLHNCWQDGSTAWISATTDSASINISMPIPNTAGGTALTPT